MFPRTFSAEVAERMAIWGFMLGFLTLLYAATAIIASWQMTELAGARVRATAAAMTHVKSSGDKAQAETLVAAIEAINAKQAELSANHQQNKILLILLTLFIVGQIVVMEYRLLIRPIERMAALLQSGNQTPKTLAPRLDRRVRARALRALCAGAQGAGGSHRRAG
jgi:beta-lactamase regulating signal transducer with metallopeptidase domain